VSDSRCVVAAGAEIGGSPVWDDHYHLLYWVDTPGRKLHRFDPHTGVDVAWDMPQEPGAVALRRAGGVMLALRDGFYAFDFMDPEPALLARLAAEPAANRLNGGRIDPAGRFWSGTVTPSGEPAGALYCLDPDHRVERKLGDIAGADALCWSPDGKVMYQANGFSREIRAWDFDAATGAIARPRPFAELPGEEGFADGATVDAGGCLWVAHRGAACVRRYDPEGKPMATIFLPVTNVTCPCFGGPDLTTLYVTSATFGLTAMARAAQPMAGGLFAIDTDITGRVEERYAG
jgi:xylono-1,5-lactonase